MSHQFKLLRQLLAASVGIGLCVNASAQSVNGQDADGAIEEIVVTGIKASLKLSLIHI